MSDRCKGDCCKDFTMRNSPEELREMFDRKVAVEIEIIQPMLTYLGRGEDGLHHYTCKHLLPSGDCGNYEGRPWMCRSFPNDRPCPYEGCKWPKGKVGMWPGMVPLKLNGLLEFNK